MARVELPRELVEFHRENNRATAGDWDRFAGHRERMTALVREAGAGRLAVLGAGNGNDLDLAALAGQFEEIHLADLDPEALARARARQPEEVAARLRVHAPVDLSGALAQLRALRSRAVSGAHVERLSDAAAETVASALPGPFEVVLSACLLSQLMHGCYLALGSSRHPHLGELAGATALGHLRALARLLAPGGTALLVTDAVSSETYPLEELWGTRPPAEILRELDAAENLFSGTSPTALRQALTQDPVLAAQLERPRLVEPWLWRMGQELTVLVYAFVLRRRPA